MPTPTATATSPAWTDEGDLDATYSRTTPFVPLDNPKVLPAGQATFLTAEDRVLGITINGESRAYPLRMMTYHHIANDVLGGRPILITF
jgi:hypothetical protein